MVRILSDLVKKEGALKGYSVEELEILSNYFSQFKEGHDKDGYSWGVSFNKPSKLIVYREFYADVQGINVPVIEILTDREVKNFISNISGGN